MSNGKDIARSRVWATVIYPDSAPENFRDIIREEFIEGCLSPLHDKDITAQGEIKKAHYHFLMKFSSVKSQDQIQKITEKIKSVGEFHVKNERGYARYLFHMDDPDKVQYPMKDCICFCGYDIHTACQLPSDKANVIREMIAYIKKENIKYYHEFAEYCSLENEQWFLALAESSTYVIREYMYSIRQKEKDDIRKKHYKPY